MARYGGMFGPDVTFLGVERCDLDDPPSFQGADVVIIGAPTTPAPRTGLARASGPR